MLIEYLHYYEDKTQEYVTQCNYYNTDRDKQKNEIDKDLKKNEIFKIRSKIVQGIIKDIVSEILNYFKNNLEVNYIERMILIK